MSRIIILLAAFALLLLCVTMTVGLSLGDLQATVRDHRHLDAKISAAETTYTPASSRLDELRAEREALAAPLAHAEWHRLLGIGTALAVILVNSIVVTYFIGTARWCREVSETYRLDPELAEQSARLKTRALPWSIAGTTAIIITVALGGVCDPMATGRLDRDPVWATTHLTAAAVTVAIVAISFYVQWIKIGDNAVIINRIMDEVRRRRPAEA